MLYHSFQLCNIFRLIVAKEDKTESLEDVLLNPFAQEGEPVDEKTLHSTHHERYQVFSFDFNNIRGAYIISLWIFVASVAKLGKFFVLSSRIFLFPKIHVFHGVLLPYEWLNYYKCNDCGKLL